MFVFKAAVVGAGTMGGEIAQVIAAAGIPVVLKDIDEERVQVGLAKAREVSGRQLAGLVSKQRLTEEQAEAQVQEIVGRIHGATSYEDFGDVDFVIEAVPERLALKQLVMEELDSVTPGSAILASNTSALSISEIAQATGRPERVVGFHFFWPASVMRLIEVVEGDETSLETVQDAHSFALAIRRSPISCGEAPGFVVNRILTSAVSELWQLQELVGLDPLDVDQAVTDAKLAPMGPFALADMTGLDTVLAVVEHLHASYGDRFYVHQGMTELVAQGKLGKKTGSGFYEHS
jgi:3-hydroxyacyl-CoA dehydrogenase